MTGIASGDHFFPTARVFSLFLAVTALVLSILFLIHAPWRGLTRGDALTFTGLLFTAAGFFAAAGRPSITEPQVSDRMSISPREQVVEELNEEELK